MKQSIKKSHSRYFHAFYAVKALKMVEGKVLDAGCGEGDITSLIKTFYPKLEFVGCDINKQSLVKYKKKLPEKTKTICGDIQRLPRDMEKFAAVILFDVLEHLEKPEKAIREIKKVVKSKGIFHLVVPCEGSLFTIDGWIKKLFGINLKKKPIGHIQQFTFGEIRTILEKNNFKILKVKYSYHFFYQLLSLTYYLYSFLFKKNEYVVLGLRSSASFKGKALAVFAKTLGYVVFAESKIFTDFPGQTVHITAQKT